MRPDRRALLAGLAVAFIVGVGLILSPATVIDAARSALYSPWFPLLLAGLYLARPFLAWPISALSLVVGYRYGLVVGFPVAMIGVVVTSLIPYAVARYVRTDAGLLGRASDGSERYFSAVGGLRGVIAARLAPVPAEVISSAAGLGRVPVPAFVLGTAIGETPWTGAAVLAGHSMRHLALSGTDAVDPLLVVGGLLAAAALLVEPLCRHVRGNSVTGTAPSKDGDD